MFTLFYIFSVCGYIDPEVNTNETSMHHLNSPLDNLTKKSDQKGIKHLVLSFPPPILPLTHCYLPQTSLFITPQAISSKSKSHLFKNSSSVQACSFGTKLFYLVSLALDSDLSSTSLMRYRTPEQAGVLRLALK